MFNEWTREQAEAFFEQWVAEEPLRRERLRERIAATDGPELDGSLESLVPFNVWFLEQARIAGEDPTPGRPAWAVRGHTSISDAVRWVQELVAQYFADVLRKQEPQARWVCFRTKDRRDGRNGMTMLDLGWAGNPVDVLVLANGTVLTHLFYDREFEPDKLKRDAELVLRQLAEYRAGVWT